MRTLWGLALDCGVDVVSRFAMVGGEMDALSVKESNADSEGFKRILFLNTARLRKNASKTDCSSRTNPDGRLGTSTALNPQDRGIPEDQRSGQNPLQAFLVPLLGGGRKRPR